MDTPPTEPPYPRDFLADFHAGVYEDDPDLTAKVYADPDAVAYLAVLEKVTDTLGQLGRPDGWT